jgi:hypothetical protein
MAFGRGDFLTTDDFWKEVEKRGIGLREEQNSYPIYGERTRSPLVSRFGTMFFGWLAHPFVEEEYSASYQAKWCRNWLSDASARF